MGGSFESVLRRTERGLAGAAAVRCVSGVPVLGWPGVVVVKQGREMTKKSNPKALTQKLYKAAAAGDVAKLKLALAEGAKLEGRPPQCPTPLIAAAKAGHIEIIRELI